jgi:hypothetical protein
MLKNGVFSCLLAATLVFVFAGNVSSAESPGESVHIALHQTVEQAYSNPRFTGNPYDLIAQAVFTHVESGESRVTSLFYIGDRQWQSRFTPTQPGLWRYRISSPDTDLEGNEGEIRVVARIDSQLAGFLTHVGNRYVRPDAEGRLQAFLFTSYMNYVDFPTGSKPGQPAALYSFEDPARIEAYLSDAEDSGFDNIWVSVGEPDLWMTGRTGDVSPNLRTFKVLDEIIRRAHTRNMHVHLWAWKDAERKGTPLSYEGGINGKVDRRLQRYIAARLGPLPGWSMGYGFDLHEWVTPAQLDAWAEYLHGQFGWDHLLAARGHRFNVASNNINSYDGFGRKVQLATSPFGPDSYAEILQDLSEDPGRPHLYEERHTYQRPHHSLDMDATRRLLWWAAMAGGMGEFVGYYHPESKAFGGYPYPQKHQFRAFRAFWNGRFLLDMEPCNQLTDGYGLCNENAYVIYRSDTETIRVDLSALPGSFPVIALNTVTGETLDLGLHTNTLHEFTVPVRSDWALAIGHFSAPANTAENTTK